MPKLFDTEAMVDAIKSYELIPERIAPHAGWLLPKAELILSICIMLNIYVFSALSIAAALFGLFVLAQLSILLRGKVITCGCFGTSEDMVSTRTVIRTLGVLGLTLCCLYLKRNLEQAPIGHIQSLAEVWIIQIGVTCLFGVSLNLVQASRNDAILKGGNLSTNLASTPRLRQVSSRV